MKIVLKQFPKALRQALGSNARQSYVMCVLARFLSAYEGRLLTFVEFAGKGTVAQAVQPSIWAAWKAGSYSFVPTTGGLEKMRGHQPRACMA